MSAFGKINLSELLHGLIVAIATSVLTVLLQMLSAGQIDWRQLALAGVGAMAAYVLKVLGSDEAGKIAGKI